MVMEFFNQVEQFISPSHTLTTEIKKHKFDKNFFQDVLCWCVFFLMYFLYKPVNHVETSEYFLVIELHQKKVVHVGNTFIAVFCEISRENIGSSGKCLTAQSNLS